jgi:hypothetical protein
MADTVKGNVAKIKQLQKDNAAIAETVNALVNVLLTSERLYSMVAHRAVWKQRMKRLGEIINYGEVKDAENKEG